MGNTFIKNMHESTPMFKKLFTISDLKIKTDGMMIILLHLGTFCNLCRYAIYKRKNRYI